MAQEHGNTPIKVVMTEANPGSADNLRNMLTRLADSGYRLDIVGYARDGLEVAQMAAHMKPDLMFIDTEMPGIDGFEACKLAVSANPDTLCIMNAESITPDMTVAAMRAGARAVLGLQQSEADVRKLIDDLIELRGAKSKPEFALATDPEKMPVSIAVTAAKGGVGKTTTATNLAVTIAKRFRGQVVLVDFFGQFGNVALSLDLHPNLGIGDLMGYEELDLDLVESHLVTHESGLKVLAGISRGTQEDMLNINIPHLAALLGMLRRRSRFTVLDIQPLLWPATPYVLSRCQHILMVATLDDIASMRDTAALIETVVKANVPIERIKLVANRIDRESQFSIRDLEETTGMKVWAQVPNEYAICSTARNEGVPFVISRPREPISRAFEQMADHILQESTPARAAGAGT